MSWMPTRSARPHVPLRRLALCLDCEACFELGEDSCPACGSTTWTILARFLSGREPRPEVAYPLAS
jgi:hypothetical protein